MADPTSPTTIDQEIIALLADRNQMWADRYVQARHEALRLRGIIRELRAIHSDADALLTSGETPTGGVEL